MALQRLKEAAEKAKIELSSSDQTEINLPYITADSSGPKHFVHKITRAKLESLVEDLVDKSLVPLKLALEDAKLGIGDINEILLVGGQTRMPMVQQKVKDFLVRSPEKILILMKLLRLEQLFKDQFYLVTQKMCFCLMSLLSLSELKPWEALLHH